MRKGILFAGFLLLLIGRYFLQARLNHGLGLAGSEQLLSVVGVELLFIGLILSGTVYSLSGSKWPLSLAIVPIGLALLSSPILFQFGEYWGNHGWGPADVANLMGMANLMLIAILPTIAFAPDRDDRTRDTAQR